MEKDITKESTNCKSNESIERAGVNVRRNQCKDKVGGSWVLEFVKVKTTCLRYKRSRAAISTRRDKSITNEFIAGVEGKRNSNIFFDRPLCNSYFVAFSAVIS